MSSERIFEIACSLKEALSGIDSLQSAEALKYSTLRDLEIQLRRMRYAHFPRHYFSDVAWDILLDLDKFEEDGVECAVTDVGGEAKIPLATILRYLSKLENDGFILRTPDKKDQRRTILTLTGMGRSALDRTFASVTNRPASGKNLSEIAFLLDDDATLERHVIQASNS
jgi:DNA-binding MarR family transcriptional regulator